VPAWFEATGHDEWDLRMAVYAAQITEMDEGIGRVLARRRAAWAERCEVLPWARGGPVIPRPAPPAGQP
jgi:hypothetical protein